MAITIQGLDVQDEKLVEKLAKTMALLKAVKPRKAAFATEDALFLTAVGSSIEMRMEFEAKREAMFAKTEGWADGDEQGYDEVIAGGGPHATAWANVRAAQGNPRPLVITNVLGGESFSETVTPWFDLNSRNRPGDGGLSSEGAALNYIPGAPIQGENLNLNEFQTNSDLGYVVRSSLMRNADLRKGFVNRIDFAGFGNRRFRVELEDGAVYADRVIDARGLGEPQAPAGIGRQFGPMGFGERVWSFTDFAKRFDEPFPFRDLSRVAVLGGGDGGKVAVEALLGIGPSQHMSVPMLDWVEQVDWYASNLPTDCVDWREQQRGRYQRIGSFLQAPDNGRQRLRVFNDTGYPSPGLGKVYVAGRPYDAVIVCIGYQRQELTGLYAGGDQSFVYGADDATRLGKRFYSEELYQVGPRAELPFDNGDPDSTRRIANNLVALFRTLPRTIQLAMGLAPIKPEVLPSKAEPKARARKAKLIGYGRDGAGLRLGDRVAFRRDFGDIQYTGTLVDYADTSFFAIDRDDGETGGGPGGSWIIPQSPQGSYLERTSQILKGDALGEDQYGYTINVGDRVRFVDDAADEYTEGYAVRAPDDDDFPVAVKRDDGLNGGGTNGAWLLNTTEYDSLEKI